MQATQRGGGQNLSVYVSREIRMIYSVEHVDNEHKKGAIGT